MLVKACTSKTTLNKSAGGLGWRVNLPIVIWAGGVPRRARQLSQSFDVLTGCSSVGTFANNVVKTRSSDIKIPRGQHVLLIPVVNNVFLLLLSSLYVYAINI